MKNHRFWRALSIDRLLLNGKRELNPAGTLNPTA
jgi:hypothetical protein